MEVNIVAIGNSCGVILPKRLMKRFNLKCRDTLVVSENGTELSFTKKGAPDMSFFAGLPACEDAYGSSTGRYLEMMEAPEDD